MLIEIGLGNPGIQARPLGSRLDVGLHISKMISPDSQRSKQQYQQVGTVLSEW